MERCTASLSAMPGLAIAVATLVMVGVSACKSDAQTIRERLQERRAEQTQPVETQTIQHDGLARKYVVHDFSRGGRAPLVILLHGGGGNSENAIQMTQFDAVARREGLIAVYPEGTSAGGPFMTWNATHCCAHAMEAHIDDVGFISAIIDRLVGEGKADPKRVYVSGMSNGGMMTHRLGRELSARIAGIAPVVGAVFGDEAPPQGPVPAFIIVGAVDQVVPAAGGQLQLRGILGNRSAADLPVSPATAAADYWQRANGCRSSATSTSPAAAITTWTGCRADVVYAVIANNGHAWPGGRPGRQGAAEPSQAWNASEEMWTFFKAHPKP
jgi:polyhydroxybutyrate depolymerase